MHFSTRTEYGLRALAYLALKFNQGYISLSKIASQNTLSQAYLERLFSKLKKAEIVKVIKGRNGGYQLTKKPNQIHLDSVIKILEGSWAPYRCVTESTSCSYCRLRQIWIKLDQQIKQILANLTLQDLIIKKQKNK